MANLTLVSPLAAGARRSTKCPTRCSRSGCWATASRSIPTGGVLHAPCDGEVISVAAARHAVALRAANGAEILLHVGIDTVALGGEGFEVLVRDGAARARRRAAAELRSRPAGAAREEPDHADRHHQRRALLRSRTRGPGSWSTVGDPLLELQSASGDAKAQRDQRRAQEVTERVDDRARSRHPCAARGADRRTSPRRSRAEIAIAVRGRSANARSAVALMSLGAQRGDELTLVASGRRRGEGSRELKQLVLSLDAKAAERAGRDGSAAPASSRTSRRRLGRPPARRDREPRPRSRSRCAAERRGSRGRRSRQGIAHESAAFERARAEVRARLEQLAARCARHGARSDRGPPGIARRLGAGRRGAPRDRARQERRLRLAPRSRATAPIRCARSAIRA